MTDTFSNPHRNEWCSLEREIFCGHLWIILLIRWMRWQDSIPKSLSASHRDHLLPILSMNRKDCIRYSWEVFRMDRRSIKNGWSPVSAAAWIRGKNLMQCLPALPTRSSGLSSAIQQKTELPMIRAASLRTVRQVPIRESWRSFYIAGLRFSEKRRSATIWSRSVRKEHMRWWRRRLSRK